MRDFIRHIQELRKKCDFQINDKIRIQYYAGDLFSKAIEKYYYFICSETLAERIEKINNLEKANEIKIQNEQLLVALYRID